MERGAAVRPAGAPMVPMPAPSAPTGRSDSEAGAPPAAARALEQAKDTVERAKDSEVAQAARTRARDEFDRRSADAAERVSGTASDVRDIAGELRKKGRDGSARLAEQAADQIERVGSYLRDADLDRVGSDVGRLARSRPAAVVVGAAAVGVLAGRIMKAQGGSGDRRVPALSGGRGR